MVNQELVSVNPGHLTVTLLQTPQALLQSWLVLSKQLHRREEEQQRQLELEERTEEETQVEYHLSLTLAGLKHLHAPPEHFLLQVLLTKHAQQIPQPHERGGEGGVQPHAQEQVPQALILSILVEQDGRQIDADLD